MKTISGKVESTAPISLSRAAKVIANFASFDNGASDSVSIYLKRASEAFDGLVQFHKDLKAPHSTSRKHTKHHPVTNSEDYRCSSVVKLEPEQIPSQFDEENRSREKKIGKDKLEEVEIERNGGSVKVENGIKNEKELEVEDGVKKRDKKKRKKRDGEAGFEAEESEKKKRKGYDQGVDSVEQSGNKNRKRRKIERKD